MPSSFTGNKRSKRVKKRKQRETRRVIREVIAEGEEFSAKFVEYQIKSKGLCDKCVKDIGQYLKDESRSKSWVIQSKTTGTPRYKLTNGGIEIIEAIEVKEETMLKETVQDRLDLVKVTGNPIPARGFSRSSEYVTRYLEAFATVLGTEASLTKGVATKILIKVCGFSSNTKPTVIGKILSGLVKQTVRRPALLDYRGHDAFGEIRISLSDAGRRVVKGSWALRDSAQGLCVLNYASGCFVGPEEQTSETKHEKEKPVNEPQFNPPRIVASSPPEPTQEPPEPVRDPEPIKPTSVDSGQAQPPRTPPGATFRTVHAVPKPPIPIRETRVASYQEFYLSRAAQRLFDVLVTECHPSDYEQVIDLLAQKLTGQSVSVFAAKG